MISDFKTIDEQFKRVRASNNRGVFASIGPLFKGAVFGRDSIEVAEDIVEFDKIIPKEVLLTLASLQGLKFDPTTEEEPGKIHHEYRSIHDIADEESRSIFNILSSNWGGNGDFFIYYGSVDSTPLYVRLAGKYIDIYGKEILLEPVVGLDGKTRLLQEHLDLAIDWLENRLRESVSGFVEYKSTNPHGIINQVWKDSLTSNLHEDGKLINTDDGVSAVEVQAYTYDALKTANKLFPNKIDKLLIEKLRIKIIESFWIKDKNFFSPCLDKDHNGEQRQSRVLSSNAGLVLDSDVLLDYPQYKPIAEHVKSRLLSSEFLTTAGIRCRSLEFKSLVDFPDYHGSYAVWFKETNDIARGFEKHGFIDEAKILAQNIVSTVASLGEYYEFVYEDIDNKIVQPNKPEGIFKDVRCNIPEPGQAWTISAWIRSISVINN